MRDRSSPPPATPWRPVRRGASSSRTPAAASGVPGLARALAREYPDRVIRAVELCIDHADLSGLTVRLVDELAAPGAPVTVRLGADGRSAPTLREVESRDEGTPRAPLDASAVIVLTGGARGITARVARRLAAETGAHLVLVGRTPMPDDEDPATADLPDRASLRAHLIAIGELGTPAAIEAACHRILADREIRATLADLTGHAAGVEYHALDVRDPGFAALLDDVRRRHGRLDGIVHGAGVLDDRFARDKTDESFDRVFGTKVEGARADAGRGRGDRRVRGALRERERCLRQPRPDRLRGGERRPRCHRRPRRSEDRRTSSASTGGLGAAAA